MPKCNSHGIQLITANGSAPNLWLPPSSGLLFCSWSPNNGPESSGKIKSRAFGPEICPPLASYMPSEVHRRSDLKDGLLQPIFFSVGQVSASKRQEQGHLLEHLPICYGITFLNHKGQEAVSLKCVED